VTIEVGMVPAERAGDRELVNDLVALVNEVYEAAEKGLWLDGAERTNRDEARELIGAGELATAYLDGVLVGCTRIRKLSKATEEFGMLAAHPAHRGEGIGRELVRYAEARAAAAGRSTVQLEVLVPREWTHPSKAFLIDWYERIGYVRVGTGRLDEAHPQLAPLLATPCDYLIYLKDLSTDDRMLRAWSCRS
jgi:GNAT superfamily N-acetyltransferase